VLPQVRLEGRREHRHPVLGSLAVPDGDLVVGEVDLLHPQTQSLRQTHTGAVKEREEEPLGPLKMGEHAFDLLHRQHDR